MVLLKMNRMDEMDGNEQNGAGRMEINGIDVKGWFACGMNITSKNTISSSFLG